MRRVFVAAAILLTLSGCSLFRKELRLVKRNVGVIATVSEDPDINSANAAGSAIKFGGTDDDYLYEDTSAEEGPVLMNAVTDESTGELVATDNLNTIVIKADYKHIAERNGIVELAFDLKIPAAMKDRDWQVRITPKFFWSGDSLVSDRIFVTGDEFRNRQLRGYRKYQQYFDSIVPDSADFVRAFASLGLLDRFIRRNIEGGGCEVSEAEAIDHYIRRWLVRANDRKKAKLQKMFEKYVRHPIERDGLRLDTLIENEKGDIEYKYTQVLKARSDMKRVKVAFSGSVFSWGKELYRLPAGDSLVYYISSLGQFADRTPLYVKKIISRNLSISTAAYIDFRPGGWNIERELADNEAEIERIEENLGRIAAEKDYSVDSIVLCAACSPEGSYASNTLLAKRRAESMKTFFSEHMENGDTAVLILSKEIPEDWMRLGKLIENDTSLSGKEALLSCFGEKDPDRRELLLRKHPEYRYVRDELYPLLRRIDIGFHLSRIGMIKDTIHTTEPDTLYMAGVNALDDKDYKKAVELLAPYRNFNSAIAYLSLGYNYSALEILKEIRQTPAVRYMTAVALARTGDERGAVECYESAVSDDPSLGYRGSLDPEICYLTAKYHKPLK